MNKQLVIGLIVGAVAVTAIGAVAGFRAMDRENYAEVVNVEPVTKTVSVPREECRDEVVTKTRPTKDPNQIAGTITGAVVGGVLGHQVGDGRGKDLATVGGAVAGGYAGNKIQEKVQERNTVQETQRVCDTVQDKRQVQSGYNVTYRLDGKESKVRMDHDPGKRIPVVDGELVIAQR
jgi:uncharacterized protein YcfJ